jgi:hypothetical protein
VLAYPTPTPPPPPPSKTPSPPVPPTVQGPYLGNFTKTAWTDVVFFRFGYYKYQKMNLVSMVNNFTSEVWYKVDLLIDWVDQKVTVYVNET